MAWKGDGVDVSAHQIVFLVWIFCSFLVDAIGSATGSLIGEVRGRGEETGGLAREGVVLGAGAGVGLAGVILAGAWGFDGISAVCNGDGAVRDLVLLVLPGVVVMQPVNGFVFVADGVLQGMQEFEFEARAMILAVGIGVAVVAGMEVGGMGGGVLEHVWAGFAAMQFSRFLLTGRKLFR